MLHFVGIAQRRYVSWSVIASQKCVAGAMGGGGKGSNLTWAQGKKEGPEISWNLAFYDPTQTHSPRRMLGPLIPAHCRGNCCKPYTLGPAMHIWHALI